MLRQQWERKGHGRSIRLRILVAPLDSGRAITGGAFAVTAGLGCDELARQFDKDFDDYNSIMTRGHRGPLCRGVRRIASRPRATRLGLRERRKILEGRNDRREISRDSSGGRLSGCPDHTKKRPLFDLLDAEKNAGIKLTESFAMWPAASVSGLYFGHPGGRYFTVDRITKSKLQAMQA